jgi:hypothetical protein
MIDKLDTRLASTYQIRVLYAIEKFSDRMKDRMKYFVGMDGLDLHPRKIGSLSESSNNRPLGYCGGQDL